MEQEELLQKIGLTKLESRIYLTLLKSGELSAGDLAKKIHVQRSTIYYLIQSLQEKGLIAESLKGKRKLFRANNPKVLEQKAQDIYKEIKQTLSQIKISSTNQDENSVLFYEGYKGLKSVYEEMLEQSKSGDEFLVLGSRGGEDISVETYRTFYQNFNDRRIKKKIKQRIIMNSELRKEVGSYYEKLALTEIKYVQGKTLAPIVIFSKAVVIVQWKEKPLVYLMNGKLIQESFKQYFNLLWKIAKK